MPMTKNNTIVNGTNSVGGSTNNTGGIIVSDASARWSDNNKSLDNINLTVVPGRLYAIIGPVGAGKVYYTNIRMKCKNVHGYWRPIIFCVITEFVDASDLTGIATFGRERFRVRRSVVCVARTVAVRGLGTTKHFIRHADGRRTIRKSTILIICFLSSLLIVSLTNRS